MIALTHQNDRDSVLAVICHSTVKTLHKGTGEINDINRLPGKRFDYGRSYSVTADQHYFSRSIFWLVNHLNPGLLKMSYHFRIVCKRTVGYNGLTAGGCLKRSVNCPLNAHAKTCMRCYRNRHCISSRIYLTC